MIRSSIYLFLGLAASGIPLPAQPAPTPAAFEELLSRIKSSAMRYDGHLPDFTCTQTTVRKEDASGTGAKWRTVDTFEELVSFAANGRVTKKVMKVNGQPSTKKRGGMTENLVLSSAIVPRGIFGDKAQSKFTWDHWETRADHKIAVLTYTAVGYNYPDGKTKYELKVSGRIFYDESAGYLIREESSSVGPPGYPFGEMRRETEFASVQLSDRALILPTASAMTTTMRGKRLYRSEHTFSNYRKYDSESVIRFDEQN